MGRSLDRVDGFIPSSRCCSKIYKVVFSRPPLVDSLRQYRGVTRGSPVLLLLLLGVLLQVGIGSVHAEHVVDLDMESFSREIMAQEAQHPKSKVMVEFYASWCPACRAFMPEYKMAGAYFAHHSLPGTQDQHLFVGRVDCAKELELCGQYTLSRYPTVLLGSPSDLLNVNDTGLSRFQGQRTAVALVKWVGQELGVSMEYEVTPEMQTDDSLAVETSPKLGSLKVGESGGTAYSVKWEMEDVETATLQLYEQIMNNGALHTGAEKREALSDILKAWAAAHPSDACKAGAQKLVAFFSTHWPEGAESAPQALREYQICGAYYHQPSYVGCKGSTPESRGFTCGLWVMFHTMSLRLPPPRGDMLMSKALVAFNNHFFMCAQCQQHFAKELDDASFKGIESPEDMAVWVWSVHNKVNARLAHVEQAFGHSTSGDPDFPKSVWPSRKDCPKCWEEEASQDDDDRKNEFKDFRTPWKREEVVKWLVRMYGEESEAAKRAMILSDDLDRASALGRAGALGLDDSRSSAHVLSIKRHHHHLLVLILICISIGFLLVAVWKRPMKGAGGAAYRRVMASLGGTGHDPDS